MHMLSLKNCEEFIHYPIKTRHVKEFASGVHELNFTSLINLLMCIIIVES